MIFLGTMSTDQVKVNKIKPIHIDEGLFEKIAKGDRNAFEELYRSTDKAVFSFILSILKNMHDSEDVMQDTYIKIRAAAHLYKPQGKPLAWIFTIARNLSLMKMRTNKRTSFSNYEDLENKLDFSTCIDQDNRLVLETAFRILDDQERKIIIMHAVTGMKHREIANILEIPLSTVLSKYTRSLKKLKKQLTDEK